VGCHYCDQTDRLPHILPPDFGTFVSGSPLGKHLAYKQSAAILGCHFSNVAKLIRTGELTSWQSAEPH
jgi:hypothetical protein